MYVIKRNNQKEPVKFDKITSRLQKLIDFEDVDPIIITQKLTTRIYPGITTTELDILASQICMAMVTDHPNYGVLGGRIAISNHQKNTDKSFLTVVEKLANNRDINGELSPLINDEIIRIARDYTNEIDEMIEIERDYLLDFFGFKTLERSYLLKSGTGNDRKIVERPQHLFMRVAIGIHGDNMDNVKRLYDNISLKRYTHATPTLFNAGGLHPQMSSCYLEAIDDSIEGIFETYRDCGLISKWAGGIGIHISNIRAKNSYIRKTGGLSDGIMTLLKTFNSIARQFNQGGKRLGSFAMYIEPHHPDIFTFLDAKKNQGDDNERARDLFYALWVPDLFMKRLENNQKWSLFCPDKCPGLNDAVGEDYVKLYEKYEKEGMYNKQVDARDLWKAVISSQIETGTPYILYKDACNLKSNQRNLGVIKSSNLCVAGDTKILTKEGFYSIKDLQDKDISVWNGKKWSNTTVRKTGENQKLLTVEFSNGLSLKCTEYHKFYIETGSRPSNKSIPEIIDAKDLKNGMKIIRYETDLVPDNKNNMKYPYTHGFFCADGAYSADTHEKTPMISLYGDKINLINHIKYDFRGEYIEKEDKLTISLPYDINDKFYVPINNSLDSKLRWLEGYLDGDGCIVQNGGIKNIQFASIHKEFMVDILYLLQTLGIQSQIKIAKKEEKSLLPDGKGSKKYYNTKQTYRMSIDSEGLDKLIQLGFSPKRLDISNTRERHHKTNMYIKITNIEDKEEHEDTWCFNEPLEHKGVFNGILTGNCSEIIQYSSSSETACCNLASICLSSIIKKPNFNNSLETLEWRKLVESYQILMSIRIFEGKLKLFTKDDCVYCKLLKSLLKNTNLVYDEIDAEEAEKYRIRSEPSLSVVTPFETVPQLFTVHNGKVYHVGGYDDVWSILKPRIDHGLLYDLSYELVENLNKVIDKNFYPIEKTRVSNMKHRPIGLGVQGLGDLFMKLKLPFDSDEARIINKEIFETMYFGSMAASCDIAEKEGAYSTFEGSPLSKGEFQFNLWGLKDSDLSGRWDWGSLRERVMKYGVRNSLLIALMPTASTSQIMGSIAEAFEPITSNLYTRRTLAGEFTVINPYLINDLIDLEIWNEDTKSRLQYDRGSVQNIKALPKFLKDVYRTSYEIPQKSIITMSAERGPFVCQSQSLNLFFEKPDFKKLTAAHFLGWKLGLKTGSYYIRSKPAVNSQRFGMDISTEKQMKEEDEKECLTCSA
jgi:ribonucleoside-diphosphate reductase alpha chain